jgi:hypothetical protein
MTMSIACAFAETPGKSLLARSGNQQRAPLVIREIGNSRVGYKMRRRSFASWCISLSGMRQLGVPTAFKVYRCLVKLA